MVVYVRSRPELDDLATGLRPSLDGFAAQGVPFTASLHPTGVLSWGHDPPSEVRPFAPSWRRWLTKKLASYLSASDASDPAERVAFAHRCLIADGVDPSTWSPRPDLWASA